ncbi:MAG: LamG-like jellyroll fold domain-containing protein, partial [Planctomycetota bacterium]
MRKHITMRSGWAGALAFLILAVAAFGADTDWDLSTPADYRVEKGDGTEDTAAEEVTVTGGVAKTLKQTDALAQGSRAGYDAGAHDGTKSGPRPAVFLRLKRTGLNYPASGAFQSRVLDAGAGGYWDKIFARVHNAYSVGGGTGWTGAEAGLISLYRFDGDWTDTGPGAHHIVTFYGNISLGANRPVGSGAAVFAGANDYADLPLAWNAMFAGNSGTVAFWVRTTNTRNQMFLANTTDNDEYLYFTGGNLYFRQSDVQIAGRFVPEQGKWYHLAFVKDDAIGRIYVDGVLIAEGAMGAWGDQTIRLGAYYNGGNDVFGSMDELAFFDSVLTAADLRAMARQGAAVRFQVRSGPTTGLAGAFVGPDGTAGTYYLGDGENLMTAGNFDSAHRYAQYRAIFLNGSTDKRNTPSVDRVDLAAADGCVRDETFAGGTHESADSETVSFTDRDEASGFVGLAWDRGLGRYQTAGSYTSRVFDAGAAADWNSLAWTVANQGAETTEADLFALWRMDGDWVDAVGGATLVPSSHTTWDPGNARFGTHAAYFDGSDDVLDSPATNGTYRYYIGETGSIAFWVRYEQADGIRYLLGSPDANTTYLYTREDQALLYFCLNGQLNYAVWTPRADTWYYFVIVRENNGDGAVYINGDEVVRTNSGPMPVERIRFGARNDLAYDFQGWIDDVAFYQRPLSVIEIRDRYARALSPRFQCRSGATNPPASAFVGPDGTAGTYYTTATGHAFGVEIPDARFFQYRASFEAPQGVATPRLATATVTYNGGTTQTDAARADFDRGVYDDDATAWRADVVRLAELTYPAERTGAESGITQLWNFNDDYNNAVGIGAWDPKGDMIANGFSSTHYRFRGYALQFDGDDDYLESNLGWDDVFEPAGSLEFWVKPNDVSTSPFVLASPSNDAGYVYLASNNRLYWRIEGQNAYWTQVWEAGQWYHIVLTKDGNDAAAYVNGQLLGTYTFSNPASSEKIRVGMRYNNGNDFNGYIDGMAVYNRALTAGEVAEYYGGAAYPTTTKTFIGALDAGTQVEWKTFRYTEDIAHGRSVGTQTEEIPIDSSGLVYLWRCNDDWTDSKGNADGVAAGGVGFASGKVDAAGSFDGTDDFVAIQNLHYTTAGEIGNLSVSCWIKTDKTNTSIVDFDRSDYYSLGVDFHSGDPNRISWDTAGPTTGVHDMASVTTVTDNQWHHVVVTFEKATGTKRIYIDGALDNEVVGAHNANEGLGIGVEDRYGYLGDGSEAEFFTFLVAERNQRYYKGLLDDVGIWTRVLTAQEVKDLYSTGGVAAVWSMDDASWTTNVPSAVSSVGGYTGTPRGDAAQDADGRVGKAATFDGAGDWLEVPHHNNFNFGGNPFSIEFWAYPVLTDNDYHCVLAKQADTNTGIQVTLHRNQRPYIRLNNVTRNVGYFRRFEWNHIVFVYDGSNRGAVYVDGVYQGQQNWPAPTDNGSNLGIGGGGITYAHTFDGKLDEVAVYNRMLTHAEIVEHCKRGLTRMTVQLSDDGGATWTDEAGNVGQSVSRSPAALSGVGPCQALLYRVQLTSLDGTVTPSLRGVEASRSFFPTNNPRVLPLAGQAYPGYLTGFVETAGAGNQGEVTYQISHDNGATWSWWNGATWASTVQGYTQSNTAAVVHANIDSFYEVRGAGTLRWRAFLHAPDGRKVVELDNVRLSYSPGGVQVTAPNAGAAVFYVTGDHDITWTTTGAVSGNWDLAYSTDSGATWTPIAANQAIADADDGAADGAFTYTWTNVPAVAVSTQARIKVTDTGDAGIRDTSDNDFTIRYPGFDITAPDGGETMLLGAPHTITWTHAGPVSPTDCTIEYSANGAGGPWTVVANNVDGSADSYVGWTAPTTATTTAR